MYQLVLGVTLVLCTFSLVLTQDSELILSLSDEKLVSYKSCRLDIDCDLNSFCYNNDNANNRTGSCKCQSGYELLLRNRTYYACRKLAKYNEECEFNIQCVTDMGSLAVCNGVCTCPEGTNYYPWDKRCHAINLLGEYCRTDGNCVLENGYAYCVDGKCECNIGEIPTPDRNRCITGSKLGGSCADDAECAGTENAVCREVCRCQVGYVISRNESTCLKAATYFLETCDESTQCSEFLTDSVCLNNTCVCQAGRHGYQNKCVRTSGIGFRCRDVEECITSTEQSTLVNCIDGVCQCLPGVVDESLGCYNSAFLPSFNSYIVVLFCLICYLFS
ncbi:multiple epidermal growth factor-like domains protein 10 isoform X2 [Sitophilus oryzae]|uniref:Multiple epidermal growth factor-like domains protein 10 isoform X2 n=1 Tax=Sitophilus oryzae TaxID=7048 RepID=A0A6J2XM56_SITOR|nr:multiple epidermal growth factor-like domains protein 10 isoform X2 [Sitophilus oryzae]